MTDAPRLFTHRFAPSCLDVFVDPVTEHGTGALRPHTAAHVLARLPDARAVLDGPMFRVTDAKRPAYRDYRFGALDYAAYDRSAHVELDGGGSTDGRGITVSVVGPYAYVLDGDARALEADAAVQLYPTLVRRGAVVAGAAVNRDAVWRAALCVTDDGQLMFAVGKCSMRAFAEALRAAGAVDAGYTDGGGSARLATRGGWHGSSEDRPVLAWLVARKA